MTTINGTHDIEFPLVKYRHPQVRSIALQFHGRGFVAGGAARALVHDIPFTDVDVFCLNDSCEDAIAHDMVGLGYEEKLLPAKSPCRVFSPRTEAEYEGQPVLPRSYVDVQLIRPVSGRFGTPVEVMEQFGFFAEQFAWDSRHLMSSFEADQDVKAMELHINNMTNPLDLAWRMNKNGKKGFTISRQEVISLFEAWDHLSTEDKLLYVDQQEYSVDNRGYSL